MPAPQREGACAWQDAEVWATAMDDCLEALHRLPGFEPSRVRAIAVDGTSGTLLFTDVAGTPLAPALMYNDARAVQEARRIVAVAPADSPAQGPASTLARWLYLMPRVPGAAHALHQADWLAGRLRGVYGDSDENNALKLGYDPGARAWPAWMGAFGFPQDTLPRVHPAGAVLGDVDPAVVRRYGWSPQAQVVAGTTDGVAAFLATGASEPGDAVTSLGTTLVLKQWCPQPLSDARCGVYSHRVGELWLAGGASNSGGAALLGHFTLAQMQAMTPQLDPDHPTGLDYYPLPRRGERFPVNDPQLEPRTNPRPADDLRFFQALLEGIAAIERRGYARLQALGGPTLRSVRTVGGGASNAAWTRLRQRGLSVPFLPSCHQDAASGSARLAWRGLRAAGLAADGPDFNPEFP